MYIVYFIPLFVIAFIALMLFGSILSFLEWLSDIIYFLATPAFIKYILIKIGIFDLILPLIKKRPKKQILNVCLLDAAKTFALIRLFCIIMPYYQKCWSSPFSSLLDITLLTVLILLIVVFSVLADIMTLRFAFARYWDMERFTGFAGGPITCYLFFLAFVLLLILGYGLFCILDFFNVIHMKEGSTLFSFLIDTGFFDYLL